MTPDDARRLVLHWLTLGISLQRAAQTNQSYSYGAGVTWERCARELARQCGLTIRITKRTSTTHPPVIDVQFAPPGTDDAPRAGEPTPHDA